MSEPSVSIGDVGITEVQRFGESLETAWRAWQVGQDAPRWEEFIPSPGERNAAKLISFVLQIDIEFRAKAGLPALLSEGYFQHPRLQYADAELDADSQLALIRWEYQHRWKHGHGPRRQDYFSAFPRHAVALDKLHPRWNCPSCRHKAIELADEAAQTLVCPHCDSQFSLAEIISPIELADQSNDVQLSAGFDLREHELYDQLGAGGMGAVYRGRDPGLGRDLAVKIMLPDLGQDAEIQKRFIREARITGSLQHPGIVPVHNLGRLPDGRLYFTMKLVRGRTFESILADQITPEEHSRRLGIFEKVCQAVAYAHSKHVIHRDLKPANIMVGRFGEVQVMDWGLAKILPLEKDAAKTNPSEPALQSPTARENSSPATTETAIMPGDTAGYAGLSQAGSLLGTLSFMPPEQASGRLHLVDERADVFALGGILCNILTGQPPYLPRPTSQEMIFQVLRGDLSDAMQRLNRCAPTRN